MWRCYITEICINLLSSIIHVIGKTRGHFILSFHGLYYHLDEAAVSWSGDGIF